MAHKYHAVKTEVDGITFDSKAESRRYAELKLLERAGLITNLQLQPRFELQPKFIKNCKRYLSINYVADFQYCEHGRVVVEDVKGVQTEVFRLKHKLFEAKYPELTLRIVD